jgi:magnesium-transporting ATPase (P-type)
MEADALLKHFAVDPMSGHSRQKAEQLLAQHGPNMLKPAKKISPWHILFTSIFNAMTLVLIAVRVFLLCS